ncbi:MAG: AcrB/AcrD/AcrF family protein, partial [Acidobacteria bacterium]
MKVAQTSFSYRKAILLVIVILLFAGVYAAFELPSGIYPEVNFPRIIIVAEAGDLPIANMTLGVTRPIEESVSGVLGLYRIRSRTIRGESELSLTFLPHADMQVGLQQVEAKVSEVRPFLPTETQLQIERVTPAIFPVLIYILTGKNTAPQDLRDFAQYTVRPTLSRIPGVGQVNVLGDTVREIEVIVDSQKLLAHHLTMEEVENAIRRANLIEAIGRMNKDYKQYLVLVTTEIKSIDTINNIPVAGNTDQPGSMVFIRDIAQVTEGTQDKLMLISGNGESAAQINVTRQIGGNILALEKDVKEEIEGLKKMLPPNVSLTNVYDLAEFVHESISSVRDAILIGCFLSVAILFFFLRQLRATLIAASSIPITLIITLFFTQQLNQTLNLMSLGGMAVAIGLVIDDAIVVVENIHRHLLQSRQDGENAEEAVSFATNEILGAVAGSTFTTVVVFLPLGLVEGVVGQFFAAFSITLSVAVLVSLVIAFTIIPILARRYLSKRLNDSQKENHLHSGFMDGLSARYERTVRWALGHTWYVIMATLLLVVLGIFIYGQLGSGFLPAMDEGSFILDYWMPSGSSLAESDRV